MSRDLGCEVVTTRTGARAMLDRASGEVMHPLVGPEREASDLYVVPARLAERLAASVSEEDLVLFDVGLGAGSNALAARRCALGLGRPARRLRIVSFERDLDAFTLAMREPHRDAFGFDDAACARGRALLREGIVDEGPVRWELRLGDLARTLHEEPAATVDVVFWDPFSPRANPALWTVDAFSAARRVCRDGATLHTYSGATATRSALLLAGFAVGFGAPTGEKAQTTVAATNTGDLDRPLDTRWLARLARSSAPFPSDAPGDAHTRIAALPQFAAV